MIKELKKTTYSSILLYSDASFLRSVANSPLETVFDIVNTPICMYIMNNIILDFYAAGQLDSIHNTIIHMIDRI